MTTEERTDGLDGVRAKPGQRLPEERRRPWEAGTHRMPGSARSSEKTYTTERGAGGTGGVPRARGRRGVSAPEQQSGMRTDSGCSSSRKRHRRGSHAWEKGSGQGPLTSPGAQDNGR